MELIYKQIWFSTQELEAMHFYGECSQAEPQLDLNSILPSGTYRVIDGELFRVVDGVPPRFINHENSSISI